MTLQQAVVVQPDGKIVLAGTVATGANTETLALARFNPGGSLDSSFGTAGKVVNPFGVPLNTTGVSLHLLSNGRFLVAGTVDNGGGDLDFYVGRLLDNGDPDPSFGPPAAGGAISFVAFDLGADDSDALAGMTVDRSGRIYLVGSVDISATDIDFGVARLTASGFLDSEFSGDGITTVAVSSGAIDLGLAVDVDNAGRVILSGAVWTAASGGHFDFALARLLSGGTLDSGFGLGGTVQMGIAAGGTNNEFAWAVATLPNGEIVAAGDIATGVDEWMFLIAHFAENGGYLDGWYGPFCNLVAPPCPAHPQDSIRALRVQGDGKMVFGGFARGPSGNSTFGVARVDRDLIPDFSFGEDGRKIYDLPYGVGGGNDLGAALALDHDGRIVVAGSAEWNGLDTDFAWARFDSNYIFADGFDWPGGAVRWSAVVP